MFPSQGFSCQKLRNCLEITSVDPTKVGISANYGPLNLLTLLCDFTWHIVGSHSISISFNPSLRYVVAVKSYNLIYLMCSLALRYANCNSLCSLDRAIVSKIFVEAAGS